MSARRHGALAVLLLVAATTAGCSGDSPEDALSAFLDAVASGDVAAAAANTDSPDAAKSVLLCHLGNIAQYTNRALKTDPKNGHILGDADATKYWSREYAPAWTPTV